ncbi:hypothetical protein AB3S75_026722 [Citrus x aurantiifolia]
MAITSILNSNRLLLSKRTVNCFDGNLLRYNVIKSLSFRRVIPDPGPKLISLQAKTFLMNPTTPILTSSSEGNSRTSSNRSLKVQQSVGVMMGGRSFPLIITNPNQNPNPNRLQVSIGAALFFVLVGLFLFLLSSGQMTGLQQKVLDLSHLLTETTKSLFLGHDTQRWISDYSPVTMSMSMSMLLAGPKRIKFPKQHRGRMTGKASRGNLICFGRYALQALEPAWITARQIEAGRRAMVRNVKRGGKIWMRIFPDKPVTARPAETRMGSGKGSHAYWAAVVTPGKIIYEISGVPENIARKAISIAASKMPIKTQFVMSGTSTSKDQ